MEDADAQRFPKQGKDSDAEDSHVEAVPEREGDARRDAAFFAFRLRLRYAWQQQDRHGVGDGGGKEDEGERHTGEDAVYGKRLRTAETGHLQAAGNPDGFGAGKDVEDKTVAHQRERQNHKRGG